MSSAQARDYLAKWFEAWTQGQQQPLVLPAELLLKKDWGWIEAEDGQMQIQDMEKLMSDWNNSYESPRPLSSDEANQRHQDWQFILQDQDANQALAESCIRFAYALYAPIQEHLEWVK